jgi:hypothetical protein
MELRRTSKFERSLGHSVIENVFKSCANELAYLGRTWSCASTQVFFKTQPLEPIKELCPANNSAHLKGPSVFSTNAINSTLSNNNADVASAL